VQVLPAGENAMTQAVAVMSELHRLSALAADWDWCSTAVIAREWKYLEPVRSYCELNHIPVQMADEEAPHFWRLRETQVMVEWLRAREIKLVDTAAIGRWLDQQPSGPWWALLREALEQYALETGAAELPVDHFIEWLAEWGREVRRRQTGLLLLTAHRAKGLEFEHVVVLDGGWEKTSKNEDHDAVRRLYYVAMTRAKNTLTLSQFNKEHVLLKSLVRREAFLFREPSPLPAPGRELARRYLRPTLREVDIGFSGRRGSTDPIHRAITALNTGDAVQLVQNGDKWVIRDKRGTDVGQLAKSFAPPNKMHCIAAHVAAIVQRRREDTTNANFQQMVRCDRWEVVVPELVFEPVSIN
jgi:ATP-dependent DNA helicase RecQ